MASLLGFRNSNVQRVGLPVPTRTQQGWAARWGRAGGGNTPCPNYPGASEEREQNLVSLQMLLDLGLKTL